jgi:hypothetical protein
MEHDLAVVVQVVLNDLPIFAVATYPVIGDPPVECGALHETSIAVFTPTAFTFVGTPGTVTAAAPAGADVRTTPRLTSAIEREKTTALGFDSAFIAAPTFDVRSSPPILR